jgi:hypothetical protein
MIPYFCILAFLVVRDAPSLRKRGRVAISLYALLTALTLAGAILYFQGELELSLTKIILDWMG